MGPLVRFFKQSGVVVAATLGAGIFALPYVFATAGWLTGIFYLLVLSIFIITAHSVYLGVLEKLGEKHRLLGLAHSYLGKFGYTLGLFSILGGLLLTLVVYLTLGGQFVGLLIPGISPLLAAIPFWLVCSLRFFVGARRNTALEISGVVLVSAIVVFIFFEAQPQGVLSSIKLFDLQNLFLPFGVILFALAGWTAVEPVYELESGSRPDFAPKHQAYFALGAGTLAVALLYAMFVLGILASAPLITSDTLSGLLGWPRFEFSLLAVLGIFAMWVSYFLIGLEIKNSLESDLRINRFLSVSIVLFLPLILLAMGANNFLKIIGLVGGVFLSLQYLLIIFVGKKILNPTGIKKFFLNFISLVFILAAVYEIYYFIVG